MSEADRLGDLLGELFDELERPPGGQSGVEADNASASAKGRVRDLKGKVIASRYEIVREIGRGGMGVVYLAKQRMLNRQIVLKVLSPALVDDEDAILRFEREARGLSRLHHPNIVTVFDFGKEDEVAYIAMEYAEGITLSSYIKNNAPLGMEDFLEIAIQILKGLGEAHRLHLIHRDIKPANIMLCDLEGQKNFVKILDFGLAKLAQGQEDVTKDQQLVGSASFLSPEQIIRGDFSTRSDVYSLGVLFYLMLTGVKPFRGPNESVLLYKHVNEDPDPISDHLPLNHNVPQALCALIDRCLSKEPADRPADANALLSEIRTIVEPEFVNVLWSSSAIPSVSRENAEHGEEGTGLRGPYTGQSLSMLAVNAAGQPLYSPSPEGLSGEVYSRIIPLIDQNKRERQQLTIIVGVIVVLLASLVWLLYTAIQLKKSEAERVREASADIVGATFRELQVLEVELKSISLLIEKMEWEKAADRIEKLKSAYSEGLTGLALEELNKLEGQAKVGKLTVEAMELESTGNLDASLDTFKQIMALRPDDPIVRSKIENLKKEISQIPVPYMIVGSPEGAEIRVDGVSMGVLPAELWLKIGLREIVVSHEGYGGFSIFTNIEGEGGLNVTLKASGSAEESSGIKLSKEELDALTAQFAAEAGQGDGKSEGRPNTERQKKKSASGKKGSEDGLMIKEKSGSKSKKKEGRGLMLR